MWYAIIKWVTTKKNVCWDAFLVFNFCIFLRTLSFVVLLKLNGFSSRLFIYFSIAITLEWFLYFLLIAHRLKGVTAAKDSTLVIIQNHHKDWYQQTEQQDLPFSVTGRDYAGTFISRTKGKRDIKVYLLLLVCSLTRAVHLEILPNQTTQEFIQVFKRLIAMRGRPKVIYSDNAETFEKASKWTKRVYKDEGMQEFLVTKQVK